MSKEYQIREGVFLESICDRYILISTIAVREKCQYTRKIDDIVAFYWEMMEEGLSVEEMAEQAAKVFHEINKNVLMKDIKDLIEQLKEAGYLLSDEEMIAAF